MQYTRCSQTFLTFLGLETPLEPISILPCHGNYTLPCWKDLGVMFLHASTSTTFLLLLFLFFFFFSSFLLTKFFWSLCNKTTSKSHIEATVFHDDNDSLSVADECSEKEDLVADIIGGEDILFLYRKSANKDTLLGEQGKDANEPNSFQVEDTFVSESAYGSPLEDLAPEKLRIENSEVRISDVLTPSDCPSPIISGSDNGTFKENSIAVETKERNINFLKDERLLNISRSHQLGNEIFQPKEVHEDEEENFAASVTGGSTSKSSIEWRSSTIFRDSETEYPFSSSSRRSSSNWESYAVFRKYDEEMTFFDRISAQKLTETESLRSIKIQPRSISQRIVHKFMTKHKQFPRGGRDPYQELESAYVAQICLTWEALNWNYYNFRRARVIQDTENSGCPAHIAQKFQQFQVLLQRFIENEPYEHGRRPEIYARMRISSPKLLQVPEFKDLEADESTQDMNLKIPSIEFLKLLEDVIRTFMNFLKADKENHCRMVRAFMKKKPSSVDPTLLQMIKKANKKKKLRLKELRRRQRCLRKRKLKEEEEMEILMGLIDMKVVSRALRMPEISEEQLHWCGEKIKKVIIWDGKMQRDSSPLFFPVL